MESFVLKVAKSNHGIWFMYLYFSELYRICCLTQANLFQEAIKMQM